MSLKKIKEIIKEDILNFNRKYKKNKIFWTTFDFFYFSSRFLIKSLFGEKLRDRFFSRMKIEEILSKAFLPDGKKMFYRIGDRGIIKEIYSEGIYEGLGISKGDLIFDLGAHIGTFSLKISKDVGEKGKIYAFEPSKRSYEILKKNLKQNKIKNVVYFNKAISEKKGKLKFFLHEYSSGNSAVSKSKKYEIVEANTLNDFVRKNKIKKINLIKMDIEGSEYGVLKNSIETLKLTDRLFLELHRDILEDKKIEEINNLLGSLGFKSKRKFLEPEMILYYK